MKKHLIITAILILTLISNVEGFGGKVYISDKSNHDAILTLEESQKLLSKDLNKIYSTKKLGSFFENGKTVFRLFAPTATKVTLVTFKKVEDEKGTEHQMKVDSDGVWETSLNGENFGLFYGFKVFANDNIRNGKVLCLDPYAKSVATYTTYMNPRKSIVVKENNYDWEGDTWIQRDWRDLIIYEMHVKDMTAHESSEASKPGTYQGLIEKNQKGGINYISDLGVNTVELLPAQEFGYCEIPFKKKFAGRYNTWNPYERNHWGYMTASFFAPAAYYSEDAKEFEWDKWIGTSGTKQITDFKDMVKAFHKEGIAVIMDVVYNHISEYELGNLKEIDYQYYFRLDSSDNFIAESGCGNDFKTERPMARRMIVESILYWMKEYHVDGFRFDLGKLIDWETVEEIIHEAKKVNPNVVIVCEPWGGGYDPAGFSLRGWGSWNDQIRNGIKGENPHNGHGWIFGKWFGNNSRERVKSYVSGTLVRDSLGLFQKKEHSVNYLESHDGYTLGDFIRIGLHDSLSHKVIKDLDKHAKLDEHQLKLNKLAAMFLFTSQGITMIHEGQEFGRSKVIPNDVPEKDSLRGTIDHNTYNKDNETNYMNFAHADLNKDLVDYYKGLIEIRKKYPAFRRANYEAVKFIELHDNHFALGFTVEHDNTNFTVLFNADNHHDAKFHLPQGNWEILANHEKAGLNSLGTISNETNLKPKQGLILIKK